MEYFYVLSQSLSPQAVTAAITEIHRNIYGGEINKIKFYLAADGGDVKSAMRLYDYLRSLPMPVETIGFGHIEHAAVLVYLAGKKRIATETCTFVIEDVTYFANLQEASIETYKQRIRYLESLQQRAINIIAENIHMTTEETKSLLLEGKHLDVKEAMRLGLVHESTKTIPLFKNPSVK